MSSAGKLTPIPRSLIQRVVDGARYAITGAGPEAWFGPMQPLTPMAPAEVKGRGWDYPVGYNLNQRPRSTEPTSFEELRALAKSCDVLRLVIETRKDQLGTLEWGIRVRRDQKNTDGKTPDDPRINAITEFLQYPDKQQTWDQWQRSLLNDLFVIDAPTIYRRPDRSGKLYALELIDGATIKPLLDDSGRSPMAPDPCYQQILHGIPAVDYTSDELIYAPRNTSTESPYGYSPVEQVMLTVNIAIRRALHQLEYYREGSQPDAFLGLPKEWSVDQIKAFSEWYQSTMSGQLGERRKLKFMPGEFKYQETKQPPLKDAYDDYLNRVICYAFSVSPQALVSMMNRATAATAKASATWEGVVPIMRWMEALMTRIIREDFNAPDLEFKYNDDLEQDQQVRDAIIDSKVKSARLTIDEARIMDGREPYGGAAAKPMVYTATGYVPIDPQEVQDMKPPPPSLTAIPGGKGELNPPAASNVVALPKPAAKDEQQPAGAAKLAKGKKKKHIKPSSLDRKKVKLAEAKLETKLKATLLHVKQTVIAHLKAKLAKDASADDYADDIDLTGFQVLVDAAQAQLSAVSEDSAARIIAQLGQGPETAIFDKVNADAVEYSNARAAEMVGMKWTKEGQLVENPNAKWAITDATRDELRRTIASGLERNIGRDAIIEEIENSAAFSEERAEMVARTEIARANSQGELISYKEAKDSLGLTITKFWMVADAPCDVCDENGDAGNIELDDDFPSGDDAPPGHPNCRCALGTNVTDENIDDNSEDNES